MNWFIDLTTRTKLILGFGLIVVLQLAVIIAAYKGLGTIRESQSELFLEDFISSIELSELRSSQNRIRADLLEMMISEDRSRQQALEKDINESSQEVDAGIKEVDELLKGRPEDLKQFEELLSILEDYRKTRDEQIALIYGGRPDEAKQLATTVQQERSSRMRSLARELGEHALTDARAKIAATERETAMLSRIFFAVGVLAIILSMGTVMLLNQVIARPLQEITATARRISTGDLAVTTESTARKDEVGHLIRAFEIMTGYLRNMASVSGQVAGGDLTVAVQPVSEKDILGATFAEMVQNLRKINQEVRAGVNVLAASAGEILASTTQVATGIAETATSVSETTATVEEVKQTAQLSTEKSRNVSKGAQEAALVAEQGNLSVAETIEGINHIKELMGTVAESVVMLSEQTQAIGEIITVVNDLAQQSNLLAVNAAIEASKAGEMGKGFVVVAQEIKSLADQSKQATEQVRAILGDIQKATGKSVLAAEQASKAVDSGVKQASESGEAIRKLADSIRDSAQAATQIAASSQQQLAGMEQVAMAMESIKQAAQQNASGTKQAEQAAHTLNELGQNLKEVVARFTV